MQVFHEFPLRSFVKYKNFRIKLLKLLKYFILSVFNLILSGISQILGFFQPHPFSADYDVKVKTLSINRPPILKTIMLRFKGYNIFSIKQSNNISRLFTNTIQNSSGNISRVYIRDVDQYDVSIKTDRYSRSWFVDHRSNIKFSIKVSKVSKCILVIRLNRGYIQNKKDTPFLLYILKDRTKKNRADF